MAPLLHVVMHPAQDWLPPLVLTCLGRTDCISLLCHDPRPRNLEPQALCSTPLVLAARRARRSGTHLLRSQTLSPQAL